MYLEIQWNGESKWDNRAQKIHGLSKEHLAKNGFTEAEAVEAIGTLIMKHWGPTVRIGTLGHNVATFDLWFLKRLFRRQGIELSFGSRHVDTSSIGFVNWNTFTSDALFEAVGFDERGDHNALDDAEMSLEAARITKLLFAKCLEE
jgi:DNA polymerase III epsilon subunit-like protein